MDIVKVLLVCTLLPCVVVGAVVFATVFPIQLNGQLQAGPGYEVRALATIEAYR